MSWFSSSVLPEPLVVLETWLVRLFLLLAVLAIVPLLLFFVFDFLLYIWRAATFEIPIIGGRARGKTRPRAPSLKENVPSKKIMSIVGNDNDSRPDQRDESKTTQSHSQSATQRSRPGRFSIGDD